MDIFVNISASLQKHLAGTKGKKEDWKWKDNYVILAPPLLSARNISIMLGIL